MSKLSTNKTCLLSIVWCLFYHLLCGVDVNALIELILKQRHHGVVPRNSVDSRVLQTHVLHQATTDLHNQRDKLGQDGERGLNPKRAIRTTQLHSVEMELIKANLVVHTRLTVL